MTDNLPLISVVIPVFNQERYIFRCVNSILSQSYEHLEVITVNDGSTDHSQQILEKMAAKDQRLVLVTQNNQGEAIARRSGYESARGEYIMFVDHDDKLLPGAIESLYNAIVRYDVDVVCGHALRKWAFVTRELRCFPDSMSERVITQKELFDNYYVSFFGVNLFPVSLWGKIYRKSVIDKAMAEVDLFTTPHLHFGGDEAFNLLLFPYLNSFFCLNKIIYLYRWGGLTSGYNAHLPELLDFSDFRVYLLDKYNYDKGYLPLFIEYVNILVSHIQQGLEFRSWKTEEATIWLKRELENRYLMQRMEVFFQAQTNIPDKCKMAIIHDVDGIVGQVESLVRQHRFRSFLKRKLIRLY